MRRLSTINGQVCESHLFGFDPSLRSSVMSRAWKFRNYSAKLHYFSIFFRDSPCYCLDFQTLVMSFHAPSERNTISETPSDVSLIEMKTRSLRFVVRKGTSSAGNGYKATLPDGRVLRSDSEEIFLDNLKPYETVKFEMALCYPRTRNVCGRTISVKATTNVEGSRTEQSELRDR